MPAFNEISVTQLGRLVGLPDAPAVIDVRTDEDAEKRTRGPCPARCAATGGGPASGRANSPAAAPSSCANAASRSAKASPPRRGTKGLKRKP